MSSNFLFFTLVESCAPSVYGCSVSMRVWLKSWWAGGEEQDEEEEYEMLAGYMGAGYRGRGNSTIEGESEETADWLQLWCAQIGLNKKRKNNFLEICHLQNFHLIKYFSNLHSNDGFRIPPSFKTKALHYKAGDHPVGLKAPGSRAAQTLKVKQILAITLPVCSFLVSQNDKLQKKKKFNNSRFFLPPLICLFVSLVEIILGLIR